MVLYQLFSVEPCICSLHLDAGLVKTVIGPGGTDGDLGMERVVDLVGLGVGLVVGNVGLGVGLVVEIVGLVIGIITYYFAKERLGGKRKRSGRGQSLLAPGRTLWIVIFKATGPLFTFD